VLLLKGYRVVGMRPIDLPSNWISLHPGLREDNVRAIYERCAAITRRFAERLLDGKRDLRALWDLPLDLLIAPISFAGPSRYPAVPPRSQSARVALNGASGLEWAPPTGEGRAPPQSRFARFSAH